MDSASPIAQRLAAHLSDSSPGRSTPLFAMALRFELPTAEFPKSGYSLPTFRRSTFGTPDAVPDRGRYRSDHRPLAPGHGRPT